MQNCSKSSDRTQQVFACCPLGTMSNSLVAWCCSLGSMDQTHQSRQCWIIIQGCMVACSSNWNALTGIWVTSFFILLITSGASMCNVSMCSKMFEMFVLTSVINISLGMSVRMPPSDGMSNLLGMPSSLSLSSVFSVGCRYLHSGSCIVVKAILAISFVLDLTIEEHDSPSETSYLWCNLHTWNDGVLHFSTALQMPL